MKIRTRFAPSPTGYLHVGSARTALYCWLYAQNKQGDFILRIEDTDRERSTQEAVDVILEGMSWLGLDYDEGPFYQTQRFDRYLELINQLLNDGHAYRCYCSKQRLEELREKQMANKEKPRYDGHCRELHLNDLSKEHVVRFKNPQTGSVVFDDAVRGQIEVANSELDDLVILRGDGTPTYNFTVVVDDADMNINMVIRGEDHISNTPRQINILQVLGHQAPKYAHIPMILGSDGKRLSKRHGAISVLQYRDDGYLPQALLNYLVRLGWSHGDQEIFSVQEMMELFNLEHVSKSPAAFNPEKLLWLNQHYLKTLHPHQIADHLQFQLDKLGIDYSNGPNLEQVIVAQRDRTSTLLDMAEKSRYFFSDELVYDEQAKAKFLTASVKPYLQKFYAGLEALQKWQAQAIHDLLKQTITELEIGMGKLAQPIRVAVTGNTISPSIDITLELIGRQRTLERIKRSIEGI